MLQIQKALYYTAKTLWLRLLLTYIILLIIFSYAHNNIIIITKEPITTIIKITFLIIPLGITLSIMKHEFHNIDELTTRNLKKMIRKLNNKEKKWAIIILLTIFTLVTIYTFTISQ